MTMPLIELTEAIPFAIPWQAAVMVAVCHTHRDLRAQAALSCSVPSGSSANCSLIDPLIIDPLATRCVPHNVWCVPGRASLDCGH